MGKTIILGRKTHESIGQLFRRKTIVISSKNFDGPNCITVESLYDALLLAKDEERSSSPAEEGCMKKPCRSPTALFNGYRSRIRRQCVFPEI